MGSCISTKKQTIKPHRTIFFNQMPAQQFSKIKQQSKQIKIPCQILSTAQRQSLNNQQKIFCRQFFSRNCFFNELDQKSIQQLLESIVIEQKNEGEDIFKFGSIGNYFYVIYEGIIDIICNGKTINKLTKYQSFGQLALLYSLTRTATARCITNVTLCKIQSNYFLKAVRQINVKNCSKIKQLINKVPILDFLTEQQKNSLIRKIIKIQVRQGSILFDVGEQANCFYMIQKGAVQLLIPNSKSIIVSNGECFGQSCFQKMATRKGRAIAQQHTLLYTISKKNMIKCLGDNFYNFIYGSIRKWAMLKSPLFQEYDSKSIDIFNLSFEDIDFEDQEIIMQGGKHPLGIIICLQGQLNKKKKTNIFCDQYYGNSKQVLDENIIKVGKGKVSFLDFKTFTRLKKQLQYLSDQRKVFKDIKNMVSRKFIKSDRSLQQQNKRKEIPWIHNLQIIKKMDANQFSVTYLVKNPRIMATFYMVKVLDKQALIKQDKEQIVINMKKIVQKISHSNIIGYVNSFIDKYHIFFLYEFIISINMREILSEPPKFNKITLKYYTAILIEVIQYLHLNSILHRNLKPESIAITHQGKLLLTNFDSSKFLNSQHAFRTFTLVGTPHYMAPQVFLGSGYSYQVDYWSIGIILHELYLGFLPFGRNQQSPYKIIQQIIINASSFKCEGPDQQINEAINKMVTADPNQRFQGELDQLSFLKNFPYKSWSNFSKQIHIPKQFRTQVFNYKLFKTNQLLEEIVKNRKLKGMQYSALCENPILWVDDIL